MVRPRLVEEGKPLVETLSSDEENDVANDEMMETDHSSSLWHHHHHQQQPVDVTTTTTPSSLLRALGGKAPTSFAPKRSMHFEIGSPATLDARKTHGNDDEHEMQCDSAMSDTLAGQDHYYHIKNNNNNSIPVYHPQNSYSPGSHHHHHHNTQLNHLQSFEMTSSLASSLTSKSHDHPAGTPITASITKSVPTRRMHFEVGADYRPTERMEGVEDHSIPLPLVVLDGANVAYAYAHARQEHLHPDHGPRGVLEPDVQGIHVACAYFADIRVRVVLPAYYVRTKLQGAFSCSNSTTSSRTETSTTNNAWMEMDRLEILQKLAQQGKLVTSPPTDDDDAYCLTIAQRENARAVYARQGQGPAFVLSNDLFRDAQARDASGQLKEWLMHGDRAETGPGRISFTFVDLGVKDDYGDPIFDFVPNPRHPLVAWIEENRRKKGAL